MSSIIQAAKNAQIGILRTVIVNLLCSDRYENATVMEKSNMIAELIEPKPEPMKRTYILQRDLPYIGSGTEYIEGENEVKNSYVPNVLGMKHERFAIHKDYVEDSPDWFRLKEPPLSPLEEAWKQENPHNFSESALESATKDGFTRGWKAAEKHYNK